ncbi:MAG: hypothetical protein IJO43_00390 [Bacilli bacterium]|nr:hypothetical protein [Bacilli bacterium]
MTNVDLRNKYNNIIYKSYEILDDLEKIQVKYTYVLEEYTFTPSISIDKRFITNKNINNVFLEYLFFNYGIVNIINYYKLSCPKTITIEAGYIDDYQINFFKKLIYNGLGEYFYRNKINLSYEEFIDFKINSNKQFNFNLEEQFSGNLILVGGGKDSIVSLELLKEEHEQNKCFLFERNIYPKNMPSYNSIYTANYTDDDIVIFDAEIDSLLLELNKKGFLNGHVPVSSLLAFSSFIMAYLNNKKYIVTSNEASSNEGNVNGTTVNHQYSKSIEFENDFREYTNKYFTKEIEYYSLLRPLLEIQIAKIFAKHEKYHNIFRSCNLSSKNSNTNWCSDCPKCLFVFTILSPFIELDKLTQIFQKNMLDDNNMLEEFKELLGYSSNKPFECVGTYEEVRYACTRTIKRILNKNKKLPYLLQFYFDNYPLTDYELINYFNDEHNVKAQYIDKIKKELI